MLKLSIVLPPSLVRTELCGGTVRARILSPVINTGGVGPAAIRVLFPGDRHVALSFCKRGVFHMFRSGSKDIVQSPRTGPTTRVLISGPEGTISGLSLRRGASFIFLAAKGVGIQLSGGASLLGMAGLTAGAIMIRRLRTPLFRGKGMALALGRGPRRCFCNNNIRGNQFSRGNGIVSVRGRGD